MAAEHFQAKPGQVDYTHIRYCPVVHTIVVHNGRILLVKRSSDLRLYPDYWSGITGFLDDDKSVEEKVFEELHEELGLSGADISLLTTQRPLRIEAPDINKTWLVVPMRANVTADKVRLNRESESSAWFLPARAKKLQLVPGGIEVLAQFFPEVI